MYGNIKNAYSVGRYWGKFWHKLPYGGYVSIAKIISEKGLKLSRKGMKGKLMVSFLVFAMSGMVHALLQKKLGSSCGNWSEFMWWVGNFGIVVLEMAIQKAVVDLRAALGWNEHKAFDITLCYAWVFLFMFWSLPKAQFPKYICNAAFGSR
ncbi:hypothetical protein BGZ60DRAFT_363717 [Tricladium varicosporioides]|nr:hypothetical protein BGZ60DRAFT_363717 [Hymenoscyphus varicosporioides]